MSDDQFAEHQPSAQHHSYRCTQCGAEMTWDPSAMMLSCQHCGATMQIPQQEGSQSIMEYDLLSGIQASAAKGFGAPVRRSRCQECGATVNFDQNTTATACDFCGSAQVLEQQENRNLIRPESLVPFMVDGPSATGLFKKWLGGLWFRPSALKHEARVSEMHGVYVPYWTIDSQVDSSWTAQAGYHYWVTEHYTTTDAQGNTVTNTRRVQRTDWRPAWGNRSDFYDDVLVCASAGLPMQLSDKLSSFDTKQLRPYDPAFLVGWKAEEYAVELADAWTFAEKKIEREQFSRCGRDVPGDTHRFLRVTNRYYRQTFKHVLLPIWISAYRYRDKVYQFLVNGQTGEVAGKAPLSWFKILLFIAVIVGIIATIIVLATQ